MRSICALWLPTTNKDSDLLNISRQQYRRVFWGVGGSGSEGVQETEPLPSPMWNPKWWYYSAGGGRREGRWWHQNRPSLAYVFTKMLVCFDAPPEQR